MQNQILLTATELQSLLVCEKVWVVDTRDKETFQRGHIPGAINIPSIFSYLSTIENGGLSSLVATFSKTLGNAGITENDTIVLYEDTLNGGYGQSCRGYFILQYLGHSQMSILHGGYQEWLDSGYPTSTSVVKPNIKTYHPSVNPNVIVTLEQMKAALADEAIVKLDCRDTEEWVGLSSSPYGRDFTPRKGRIPGAVWLAWTQFIEAESPIPKFADNSKILALCESVGIRPETPVYVYCFKGSRSSNTMLALQKAGLKHIRNYFGSWNEWSRDFSLPIDDRLLSPLDTHHA